MLVAASPATVPAQRDRWGLLVCLGIALVLRLGVMCLRGHELTNDRDAYLAIARCVVEGHGYSDPVRLTPTAFRAPFYPLQLAGLMLMLSPSVTVALLNLGWSVLAVWSVWRAGYWFGLGSRSTIAALLVAIDPMLLQYSAQPMTEVCCAGLVALLVLWLVRRDCSDHARRFVAGLVFGGLVLCRPTFWPLAGLALFCWGLQLMLARWRAVEGSSPRLPLTLPWGALLGTVIVVAPWVIRNQWAMGSPIVMTTHGGYTLLLANNPVFYSEVVERGWGSQWTNESFEHWQQGLQANLAKDLGPDASEIARDRWQSRHARDFIAAEPLRFAHAVGFRIRSLWSPTPQSDAAASPFLVRVVGVYYMVVELLFVVGMVMAGRACWREQAWSRWWSLFALIATVQVVHLIYWTNARMRAPIVPVISLLAVVPLVQRSKLAPSVADAYSAN